MADRDNFHASDRGGSSAILGVILGALLMSGGIMYLSAGFGGGGSNASVNVSWQVNTDSR